MNLPLRQYTRLLSRYLRPMKTAATLLAFLLLSSLFLQLLNPQIIRRFIDAVQTKSAPDMLARMAVLYLGIAVVQQIVAVLSTYMSENIGWSATNALRADLAEHCLVLDLSFHNAHTPGEMIERIDGDVTALSNFFSKFVIQIIGNGLLLAGILVLLFLENLWMGLSISMFALLALIVLGHFRNLAVPHWAAERQASAELFGFLEERLAGTEEIRANGAKAYVMNSFFRRMRTMMQRSLKAGLMGNILYNIMFILVATGTAVAFALGAYLFERQVISLGTVYILFQYTTMLQRPLEEINRQIQDLQKAGAGIQRVQELLRIEGRIQNRTTAVTQQPETGRQTYPEESGPAAPVRFEASSGLAVEFDKVTFGYHEGTDDEPVLRDISFRLAPGAVLGLLGRTGSGKTSLTRLIFRLFDPDSGSIRVGPDWDHTFDLRDLPPADLRDRVGMITQNIQLFNATVRDNLTFFDNRIPNEQIQEALHSLGLWSWYSSLPQGLDTELDTGGGGLSAGQAQLLAFTRVFLRDPALVILDEASSRLDPATEGFIERAIDQLVQGRTAIIVAHRLHTVQRADQILILERGQILEAGPRAALAADPESHFHRLLQTGLSEVLV